MSAAVVLLPFVPLTASTPSGPCSASHRAVAVVTGMPAALSAASCGLWIEAPGERTTTSQADSAACASAAPTTCSEARPSRERTSCGGRRIVEGRHGDLGGGQMGGHRGSEGADLAAGAPDAEAPSFKLREAHARLPSGPRAPRGPRSARARGQGLPRRWRDGAGPPRRAVAPPAAQLQRSSAASSRMAARLSCSSPTHSNGLWPPAAQSSAKPSNWSSSSSRSRPKISRSCSGVVKGASARNTNRHLGQSQHQEAPRSAGSRRKIVLQLVNARW